MTTTHRALTPNQVRRKSLISGTVGAIIEWYEYTVYGTAAALVFGTLFFPSSEPGVSQIAALASFGVGFLARPVGAFVSGHLGDRIGRKSTLILTFLIMSISTAAIGLLPTYQSVGFWAPVLLCILRLTQGFAVGGEWGGAAIIAVENAPKGRRGFFGSWPQIGVSCGLLLGTGAVAIAQAISGDQFIVWGWRLPFLLSVLLAAVGLYIRLNASESPAFLAAKAEAERKQEKQKAPIPVVFKEHRRALVIALFSRFAEAGNYYLFTVFLLSYVATTLKLPASYGLVAVMIGSALNIAMIPVFGAISDRIGRKNTFFFGAAVIIVSAWPIFAMIQTGNPFAIIAGVAIFLTLGHAAVYSVLPAFYCELFPTEVRYTGISVGYQTAAILLAGFTPVIASALVLWSGGTWPLVAIIVVTTLIAVTAVAAAKESKDLDLDTIGKPTPRRTAAHSGVK
ncbi:Proline/betaine transporter [Arthrobacter sp. Bi26]|uniref:MFS transporter n=1 Tax=Arthrobacter sp. Bi26 TaxID=2822350 RepID=UPI001D789006|nr:MFS transporter [Arthrobacter sp. Bi26]CAH0140462.1 Proline/betaine transporter [Arthrobacter sp. Bi26]